MNIFPFQNEAFPSVCLMVPVYNQSIHSVDVDKLFKTMLNGNRGGCLRLVHTLDVCEYPMTNASYFNHIRTNTNEFWLQDQPRAVR